MPRNALDLSGIPDDADLWDSQIDEMSEWKNLLIGVCKEGFIYISGRNHRLGHYEFVADFIPDIDVVKVTIDKTIPRIDFLAGILGIAGGAAWIWGIAPSYDLTWPWIRSLGGALSVSALGVVLIIGLKRTRVVVATERIQETWISPPLSKAKGRRVRSAVLRHRLDRGP